MTPTLSIVVPTYRRRKFLEPMVDALLAGSADEILFVVDGSDDGSYEYLTQRASADGRLRPIMQVNRGRAAARQRGADEATGEVALFLDDDVVPDMDVAAAHAREHDGTGELVTVGTMATRPPRWDARARLYDQQYREIVERWRETGDVLSDLWAGHFALRTEALRRAGGFGPVTTMGYHDDWAFGLRCRAAGLRGRYCAYIVARHVFERSADGFLRDVAAQAADRETMRRGLVAGPLGAALAPEPAGIARMVASTASRVPQRTRRSVLRAGLALVDRLDARRPHPAAVSVTRLIGAVERNAVAGELARQRRPLPALPQSGVVVVARLCTFVAETIASVLAQSHPDWRLVVVDAGGEDVAAEAERLIRQDPRAVLISVSSDDDEQLRTTGCRALPDEVSQVLFLTAGEVLQPSALEQLASALVRDPACLIARPRAIALDERGLLVDGPVDLEDGGLTRLPCGGLVRRSALSATGSEMGELRRPGAVRTVERPLIAYRVPAAP